jgi:hypothetical protein
MDATKAGSGDSKAQQLEPLCVSDGGSINRFHA